MYFYQSSYSSCCGSNSRYYSPSNKFCFISISCFNTVNNSTKILLKWKEKLVSWLTTQKNQIIIIYEVTWSLIIYVHEVTWSLINYTIYVHEVTWSLILGIVNDPIFIILRNNIITTCTVLIMHSKLIPLLIIISSSFESLLLFIVFHKFYKQTDRDTHNMITITFPLHFMARVMSNNDQYLIISRLSSLDIHESCYMETSK